jgi:hypothetical protein
MLNALNVKNNDTEHKTAKIKETTVLGLRLNWKNVQKYD